MSLYFQFDCCIDSRILLGIFSSSSIREMIGDNNDFLCSQDVWVMAKYTVTVLCKFDPAQ